MTTASCSPEQKPIPSKGQTPPLGYRRAAFLSFSQRRKRGAVDCTAAQAGSGGPPGERNGQYRHGERTKAAIAEQQKFSALLEINNSIAAARTLLASRLGEGRPNLKKLRLV